MPEINDWKEVPVDDWEEVPVEKSHQSSAPKTEPSFWGNVKSNAMDIAKGMINPETYKGLAKMASEVSPTTWLPNYLSTGEAPSPLTAAFQLGKQKVEDYSKPLDYAYNRPLDVLMDAATLFSMGGALPGAAGKVATIGERVTNPVGWPGELIGGARQAVGATGIPEWMMTKVLKTPPGEVGQKVKASISSTVVNEGKMVTKNLPAKMSATIARLDNDINDTLNLLTASGAKKVNLNQVSRALNDLKLKYKDFPNPQEYYDAIDQVKQAYLTHPNAAQGEISLIDAHNLKKGTYKEIGNWYRKTQGPETKRVGIQTDIEAVAKDTAARALREAVINHPDVPDIVKTQLGREAGLMEARRWVERAVNKGENIDPVRLTTLLAGILIDNGVTPAIAYRIAGSQPAMSQIAIWLKKGSQTAQQLGDIGTRGYIGAYQIGKPPEKEKK